MRRALSCHEAKLIVRLAAVVDKKSESVFVDSLFFSLDCLGVAMSLMTPLLARN